MEEKGFGGLNVGLHVLAAGGWRMTFQKEF